jgi:hypothetical protein
MLAAVALALRAVVSMTIVEVDALMYNPSAGNDALDGDAGVDPELAGRRRRGPTAAAAEPA